MKNTRYADFCANQIDVITNFAVITYVVIKRFHCIMLLCRRFPLYIYILSVFTEKPNSKPLERNVVYISITQ